MSPTARKIDREVAYSVILPAVAMIVAGVLIGPAPADEGKSSAAVDSSGTLRVPDAYRTTYQFLGAWAVAKEQGQGSEELHIVYASPGTIAAFRKSGHFPDGAVLVKEVHQADTGTMTTGTVSHADRMRG